MNTCDTCKWWKSDPRSVQCQCMSPKVVGRNPKRTDEAMTMIDNPQPWEGLYTGPKFGCIHHEALTTGAN